MKIRLAVATAMIATVAFGKIGETDRWQAEIDRTAAAGGGRVTIPAGRHLTGTLFLRSNVTLELAAGCVLEGSTNRVDYPDVRIEYAELREPWQGLIVADGQTNVAVVGEGEIFGNGRGFPHGARLGRPQGLLFHRCRGVRVENVRLRDLARWTCYLKECDGCVFRNVTVDSHANGNNDGIDIDSRNVLVENCDFDSDDDGIVFKSDNAGFIVENVTVRNCRVRSTCSAIKLGTGSHGGFRNILVENVVAGASPREWCNAEGKGVISEYRVQTWPGSEWTPSLLSGIALECVDGGLLENVTVRNVTVERAATPIFIRGGLRYGRKFGNKFDLGLPFGRHKRLSGVLIENVKAKATSFTSSSITGVPGLRVADITLRNVDIVVPGAGEAGRAEIGRPVPEKSDKYPEANMFDSRMLPACGFYVRHADNVAFEDVRVTVLGPEPRPAIVTEDVTGFKGGVTLSNGAALQAAVDRCAAAGGGVVEVPSGRTTMAGVLTLRSNVTLRLRDDSEIFFPDDPALYGRTPALVYAEGATNVSIVGKGVIRAKGERWHREIYLAKGWRPRFFQFRRCEGVRLEDFRVRGSPMWTLHLLMSKKIVLRGLDVFVRGGNTDGVDIDSSQDVLIENCRLDQGDDGFVMKSGKNEEGRLRAMPTKNVTIRNCTVVNAHTLLGIGSELSGGVEDVHLENCTVEGKVWKVLYIKSSRARGGWARNISVRNVTCERAKVCVFGIRTDYADTSYSAESTDRSFLTPMEDIVMENVTVDHGWRMCEIDGFEELPPKGVVLRNVTLKHATRGESEIRNAGDLRQENVMADMGPFSVWCDEPDAKYDCGETAVFTVVAHTNAGVATVRLDNFGKGVLEERTVDFAKTPRLELKGTRDIPGFLLLTVRLGKETKRCGASFGRRQITGGAEKPADFESFWREAIAKYDREVPVDVKLERSGLLSTNGCDVFRVELSDPFGRTVSGYLKEPKDLSGGPFPVLVNIPGAGPCIGAPTWESASHVELVMNVHYWKPVDGAAKRGKEHTALQDAEDKAWLEKYPVASNRRYCVCGIAASREEYYYYGAILAIRRAVQWLRTRPEVDPDRFIYWGGSQGGGMGLALMALDGRFRRGAVLVPALTAHHCHRIDGRQEGWPNLLLSQLPENEDAASRNAPYFDGVNFASMIRHPVLFTASYTDTVAPPHAAYAAYNACPAKEKYVMDVVGFGHEGSRVESGEARRWLLNEDHEYTIPIANMTCPWSPWR